MDVLGFFYLVAALLCGIFAGGGYAVVAMSPAEFRHSRYLFFAAGVMAGLIAVVWGVTTDVGLITRIIIIGIFGALIAVLTTEAVRWVTRRENPPIAQALPSLDNTIRLECSLGWIPPVVPDFGFYLFILTGGDLDGALLSSGANPPGSQTDATQITEYSNSQKCRFTNFGNAPLVSIQANITIIYQTSINVESGTRSGEVVKTFTLKTPPSAIGIGNQNIFDFYICNKSPYWANIQLPSVMKVRRVGSDDFEMVKLIPPTSQFLLGMAPSPGGESLTNHPETSRSVQVQPSTPEKK